MALGGMRRQGRSSPGSVSLDGSRRGRLVGETVAMRWPQCIKPVSGTHRSQGMMPGNFRAFQSACAPFRAILRPTRSFPSPAAYDKKERAREPLPCDRCSNWMSRASAPDARAERKYPRFFRNHAFCPLCTSNLIEGPADASMRAGSPCFGGGIAAMSRVYVGVLCLILGALGGAFVAEPILSGQANAPVTTGIPKELTSYRDVVKKVVPAVVSIKWSGKPKTTQQKPNQPRRRPQFDDEGVPEEFRRFFEEFQRRPFGLDDDEPVPQEAFGSGFLVDHKGVILTNHHVLKRTTHL